MNKLLRKKDNSTKKKKGFTLVELIIVIAIIAILAAIAIPKFGAVRENSNKAADIANAKNISLAVSKAIAEGKIDYSAGIPASDLDAIGTYNITGDLDGVTATTTLKTTGFTGSHFQVAIAANGDVTVTENGTNDQLYPVPNAAFDTK